MGVNVMAHSALLLLALVLFLFASGFTAYGIHLSIILRYMLSALGVIFVMVATRLRQGAKHPDKDAL
jgi:hypothetical protein